MKKRNKNDIDNNSIVFLKKLSQFYISSHNQKIKHLGLWDKIFNDSKHKQDNRYLGCESELLKYDHELLHKSLIIKHYYVLEYNYIIYLICFHASNIRYIN